LRMPRARITGRPQR